MTLLTAEIRAKRNTVARAVREMRASGRVMAWLEPTCTKERPWQAAYLPRSPHALTETAVGRTRLDALAQLAQSWMWGGGQ